MSFSQYMNYYQESFMQWWRTMTPMEYAALLIAIAVGGYLLMKSSR